MIFDLNWIILDSDGKFLSKDNYTVQYETRENCKHFNLEFLRDCEISECYLEFELSDPIVYWRNHDYTWKKLDQERLVANTTSPKILKLNSGGYFVARNTKGCWVYQPGYTFIRWYFFHPMLTPTFTYDVRDQRIFLKSQNILKGTSINSGWSWGATKVEEWARTPLGFVSTLCFTDHSDFDSIENLQKQRELFKKLGVKITKGFFLYDYTHKAANASFEDPKSKAELIAWSSDGHELAYHSLSQSYRGEISDREFDEFESPPAIPLVDTYIDHGFHPYNYTKQELGNLPNWYSHMEKKGVKRIWSYVDAGEAHYYCLNQLNPNNFTLGKMRDSFGQANQQKIKRSKFSFFKYCLMYGVPESLLRELKFLGGDIESLKSNFSSQNLKKVFSSVFRLGKEFVQQKNFNQLGFRFDRIFENNQFCPVLFLSPNQKNTCLISFQTVSVHDFDLVFSEGALQRFTEESGIAIAHTYFALSEKNHNGRIFENELWEIRKEASKGFENVSQLIKENKIWNPTLQQLQQYHSKFDDLEYSKEENILKISGFEGIKRTID